MELQLFFYKDIALHFYYSKNSLKNERLDIKEIFIYFPGLPQMVSKDFFANKVSKDVAFLSVYYLGSWLSGDNFTYENCKKTVELAIEFIKRKKGIKTFDNKPICWDYENLHVLGYSFAGNPIISAKISKNDVKNVVLFAPLLFLHKKDVSKYLKKKKDIDAFYKFSLFYLEFLKRGYKFAFRGIERKAWDKHFSGLNQKSFVEVNSNYPDIFIFHGKRDEKIKHTSSLSFQKEKDPEAKIILINNADHSLKKLFDMKTIKKLI